MLLLPALLASSLVACGSDSGSSGSDSSSDSSSSDDSLQGIVITGDIGTAPEVKWNGELKTAKTETTVVTKGDGAELAEGDQVSQNLWIGNGTTQEQAYSTYDY